MPRLGAINIQSRITPAAFPGLDYPDVSAGGKGFENIREFRLKVMAGLDPHKR
jgi:hypothetical protein